MKSRMKRRTESKIKDEGRLPILQLIDTELTRPWPAPGSFFLCNRYEQIQRCDRNRPSIPHPLHRELEVSVHQHISQENRIL